MKLYKKIPLLAIIIFAICSCEKNEISYNATTIGDVAEFQLHYVVPLIVNDTNNINKVEINDQLYANITAPLSTFNAIPSGSVGRFFTSNIGNNNIKLYKGKSLRLVYNQNCSLSSGKQNIFVYDFNKPPIVLDNGYPYQTNITENSDSTAWIKFYNFMFESNGVPTTLKLQYQYQYTTNYVTNTKSAWINIGSPVSFGETTGWQAVRVNKSVNVSSGYARLDFKLIMIGSNGESLGDLMILKSTKSAPYADYWSEYIGRRYHHILTGIRTAAPNVAVKQFTAL